MLKNKLAWYYNRFRCMSAAEMLYRAVTALQTKLQERGFLTAKPPMIISGFDKTPAALWVDGNCRDKDALLKAADRILDGYLTVFAKKDYAIGHPPEWNRDPLTATLAPLDFGKTMNYRSTDVVGDIKYLWEPSRHLQLTTLAQAYHVSRDEKYLDGLAIQLNSWFDQCPYLKGVHWISSLEHAIRLINWSFIWQLIGGANSPIFAGREGLVLRDKWLTSIYQHAHFIRGHFSRFSSANNHLIGELSGLFTATVTWPYWPEFTKWQKLAQKGLIHEAEIQNSKDGVNLEQAISYQQFVLDFLLIPMLAGKAADIHFPGSYRATIERMLEYLASIMDKSGHIPMIGDADDGYAVKLSHEDNFCPYRSLLASGAILFDRADFKQKAGYLDDKTRWLLGAHAEQQFEQLTAENILLPVHPAFHSGGYYILGKEFEASDEIRMIIDAGALGYQSIAAHGHADALAIYLSIRGKEFLIDPGTYSYHAAKEWRNYFRGTAAHNTIKIDDTDQSEIGGPFMWMKKAHAQCDLWQLSPEKEQFSGWHDGYMRLKDPLRHQRDIDFFKKESRFLITDVIKCEDEHLVEQYWHFSELCNVSIDGQQITAVNDGVTMTMHLDEKFEIAICKGQNSPPCGWVSRQFDVKVPCTTVVARKTIKGTTKFVTEIKIKCQHT